MSHNLQYVQQVMDLLDAHGISTWLFGGWAEELHGVSRPRPHRDVDLLYVAESFAGIDQFLKLGLAKEIVAKRLPHKRAFVLDGVMTEIVLVQSDLTTTFWGRTRFHWPADTFAGRDAVLRLASPAALARYREAHDQLHR